jgi:exosortase
MVPLSRADLVRAGLYAVILAFVYVLFHLQGNTTDIRAFGRSAILWMVSWWKPEATAGTDYSHGWLIPIASLGIIWMRRLEIVALPKRISGWGLLFVILALLMHWLGARAQQTRLSLLALIMLLWALPFFFCGFATARRLLFPCAYLLFCVPMTFLDSMTFPLQVLATVTSTGLLNGLGLPAIRSGTYVSLQAENGFHFEVGEGCSGIRSMVALMALTAAYGFLTQRGLWRKWALFLSSVPIAIACNVARITTVGLVAAAYGEKFALNIYHDYSGYIVFTVAILLMLSVSHLLSEDPRTRWKKWKYGLTHHTLPSSA